jgi:hypothetical protein
MRTVNREMVTREEAKISLHPCEVAASPSEPCLRVKILHSNAQKRPPA